MLWVYGHSKYFYSYSPGIDFRRQNLTSTDVYRITQRFPIHLNTYIMGLRPLEIFSTFTVYTDEIDQFLIDID